MNDDTAKGTFDKITGKLKETVGHVTGNHELEAEGKLDQAKGTAEKTVGHTKDAAHELGDAVRKATE